MEAALYAYAVVRRSHPLPDAEPVLPGAELRLVGAGGVAALVSEVPRGLFEAGPACRTDDPGWVAARAAAHHGVITAAAADGPALPMAFGGLFSGADPLRAWLGPREQRLAVALGLVTDSAEWTVSLSEDSAMHGHWLEDHDPALQGLAEEVATATPGRRFLLQRRLERDLAAARVAHGILLGAQVTAAIGVQGRALRADAAQGRWSFLLPNAGVDRLRERLEVAARDLATCGFTLALSGPWPPYAFAREVNSDA